MIFTINFWRQATERAVKTFAQTALSLLGAGALNILVVDWTQVLGVALGATVLSYLTSVVSIEITKSTISLTKPE